MGKNNLSNKSPRISNIVSILLFLLAFSFTTQKVFSQGVAIIANEISTDADPSSTTEDGAKCSRKYYYLPSNCA